MVNRVLQTAKKVKQDEFYTQLNDISNELRHYKDQLRNKIVLCNCDDPFESNFFKYFASNFNHLGLRKLIATSYDKSLVAGTQLGLFEVEGLKPDGKQPFKIEINEVPDNDNDGVISLSDVEYLLKHNKNTATPLIGNGDFRSSECIELLKEADLVITNPPFSLFREYMAQLFEHNKKFLIIGSKNAITYKETFKLIHDYKLWLGHGFAGGNAYFRIPSEKAREFANGVYDEKTGLVKFRNVGWFTNLYVDKSEDSIMSYLTYEEGLRKGLYPKYDNFDAIEVSKIAEIPSDYYGVMGVPITFLDKWAPPEANAKREREREREENSELSATWGHMLQTGILSRPRYLSTGERYSSEYLSSAFRIIGLDRYAQGNKTPGKRMCINGKEIYARILIQRI